MIVKEALVQLRVFCRIEGVARLGFWWYMNGIRSPHLPPIRFHLMSSLDYVIW